MNTKEKAPITGAPSNLSEVNIFNNAKVRIFPATTKFCKTLIIQKSWIKASL